MADSPPRSNRGHTTVVKRRNVVFRQAVPTGSVEDLAMLPQGDAHALIQDVCRRRRLVFALVLSSGVRFRSCFTLKILILAVSFMYKINVKLRHLFLFRFRRVSQWTRFLRSFCGTFRLWQPSTPWTETALWKNSGVLELHFNYHFIGHYMYTRLNNNEFARSECHGCFYGLAINRSTQCM